jgi:hypothetical protein
MGQVIPFPAAALAYPTRTDGLDDAESLLLLSIRWWVAAIRHDEEPTLRLELGLGPAGLRTAVASVHAMMTGIARTARRPLDVYCPRCPTLSADEAQLLDAASLAQAGEREQAYQALALVLLSARGAEFVLEPLAGLGTLFAAAGRLLHRRRTPLARPEPAAPPAALLH